MKLQKIILCTAIALTAFGASLGLLELGAYVRAAFQPLKIGFKLPEPVQAPVVYPPVRNIPAPAEETAPVEEAEPEDYGETGDYYIIDEKPKGFADFETLVIKDREWNEKSEKLVPIKPQGSIQTYLSDTASRVYNFSWINIKGKKLSLGTKAKKGVSYQFEGRFLEQDVELKSETGEKYTETIYLKGRLSKWRDGKKIAEAKVRMSISHGC